MVRGVSVIRSVRCASSGSNMAVHKYLACTEKRRVVWVIHRCALCGSHAIPRAPAPEIAALLAHEAREDHVVHLGGAVDEARLSGVTVNPLQDRVFGVAARAVELNGDVGRPMQHVGDVHLGHGHFLALYIAMYELPCGLHIQMTHTPS